LSSNESGADVVLAFLFDFEEQMDAAYTRLSSMAAGGGRDVDGASDFECIPRVGRWDDVLSILVWVMRLVLE